MALPDLVASSGITEHPLGPKPWTADIENSDRPCHITVVDAANRPCLVLTVIDDHSLMQVDEDRMDGIWRAGIQLAEQITGRPADAPTVRLRNGMHAPRYFAAARVLADDAADGLEVDCPSCGEEKGNSCS